MNLFLDSVVVIIVVFVEQPDFKKRPIKMFAYLARTPTRRSWTRTHPPSSSCFLFQYTESSPSHHHRRNGQRNRPQGASPGGAAAGKIGHHRHQCGLQGHPVATLPTEQVPVRVRRVQQLQPPPLGRPRWSVHAAAPARLCRRWVTDVIVVN